MKFTEISKNNQFFDKKERDLLVERGINNQKAVHVTAIVKFGEKKG